MEQDLFKILPSEITINILSRLPVRTVSSCKCVCKSWRDLLETREFVDNHISYSVPGLAIYHESVRGPALYSIFEFEDRLDLDHHELRYNVTTEFEFPRAPMIWGSANGLLLLSSYISNSYMCKPDGLYVCNPITREYIQIQCPFFMDTAYLKTMEVCFGFGVSKTTGQYKVVKIYREFLINQDTLTWDRYTDYDCQVYTLGTGLWRSIELDTTLYYDHYKRSGVFLNGNLHWLVCKTGGVPLFSCLDLETELFSSFPSPPWDRRAGPPSWRPFAFEDCLCVCDVELIGDVVVWLMKEYGDGRSWTKEFTIRNIPNFRNLTCEVVRPIKVFKDGDVLMAWESQFLFYYSKTNKTTRKIDMIQVRSHGLVGAILHTSSFFQLKGFATENVVSF